MATILNFPQRPRIREALVISLYTDEEIDITVAAVNLHGTHMVRITADSLSTLDAESVELCLRQASINELLSNRARRLACSILASIEHINIRQQM
jgi:hypothetical protein